MGPITMNKERHEIGTPPIYHRLRREYPTFDGKRDAELFTYRHKNTGNWVVALWLDKDRGRAIEVHIIGKDPDRFPPPEQAILRKVLLQPRDPRSLAATLIAEDAAYSDRMNNEGYSIVDNLKRSTRNLVGGGRHLWPGWSPS